MDAVKEIETNTATLTALETDLLQLMQSKEIEQQKLNEADQTYYNLRNTLSEKETTLRQKQKQKDIVDQQLNEVKDKVNELKLQVSGTKERLQVEFKINIEDILDQERTGEATVERITRES